MQQLLEQLIVTNMELLVLTSKIKSSLDEYVQTDEYKLNNYPKDIVSSIFIAINLAEIASRNSKKIRQEDHFWYEGAYQVGRLFDNPKWQDIGVLFADLSKLVKEKYF